MAGINFKIELSAQSASRGNVFLTYEALESDGSGGVRTVITWLSVSASTYLGFVGLWNDAKEGLAKLGLSASSDGLSMSGVGDATHRSDIQKFFNKLLGKLNDAGTERDKKRGHIPHNWKSKVEDD